MDQTILLTIGYDTYAVPVKPGVAGKLLEILSNAVPVRYEHRSRTPRPQYRIQLKSPGVKVELIERRDLLPPTKEDMDEEGTIELQALPGAVRLLKKA
jgi:hypothetical protein